ncbi:hypothetical protein HJC23_008449 [Cyclotella cryptica]|uniref:Uncharacterized protein n=1 Tax=Cyclotella cryptica TaxID=29204 RepID=A0ABD3QWL1_9STRA
MERIETPRRPSRRNQRTALINLALKEPYENKRKDFESKLTEYEKSIPIERNYFSPTKSDLRSAKKKLNDDWHNESRHAEKVGSPESVQDVICAIEKMTNLLKERMQKHEENTIEGVNYLLEKALGTSNDSIIDRDGDKMDEIKTENETLKGQMAKHVSIAKDILSIAAKLKKLTVD